jgi:callose synthase
MFLIVEVLDIQDEKPYTGGQWIAKTNFVEIRSFWHIFRSFDRMWSFYILSLQVILSLLKLFLFRAFY